MLLVAPGISSSLGLLAQGFTLSSRLLPGWGPLASWAGLSWLLPEVWQLQPSLLVGRLVQAVQGWRLLGWRELVLMLLESRLLKVCLLGEYGRASA